MAYTQEDLDRVRVALTGTELEVQFADGKRVRYRSLAELRRLEALIAADLVGADGRRGRPASWRINVSKGV